MPNLDALAFAGFCGFVAGVYFTAWFVGRPKKMGVKKDG
jgi:hypothetical protein